MENLGELSFEEARDIIKNVTGKRSHSIKSSLGVYDAYKWTRKNKWLNIGKPVSEHDYYKILRRVNQCLLDALLEGNDIVLPYKMGIIQLVKSNRGVKIKDGVVTNSFPIDWDRTLKLWHEDKESFNNKVLVRAVEKEVYKVHYSKSNADYINQCYYQFSPNRELKLRLKDKIKNNEIDAFGA